MNPRTTGILFLVAAGLAAFVYFYEIAGREGRLSAEEARQRVVLGLEAEDIREISLTTTDGTAVRLRAADGRWTIIEPFEYPADRFVADAMAAAIAQMGGGNEIEAAQDPAVYGLEAVAGELRFRAGDEEQLLRIGNRVPLGAQTYVTLAGSGSVFAVPNTAVSAFTKSFDDLREKRVLVFDTHAVEHIAVDWPDGGVVLERSDSEPSEWYTVRPVAGLADAETVARLLSNLESLRADGFVDDPPDDAAAGLVRPTFSVRLSGGASDDSGDPFEVALAIGNAAEAGTRLARGAPPGLYRISEDRVAGLRTTVAAYRDKQLARFPVADAKRVEIEFSTANGQSLAITAKSGEGGWVSEPEAFGTGQLDALVGALASLRAIDIAAEAVGDAERAALGLAPANAIYTVYGQAPEGEEAPVLAVVRIGGLRGSEGAVAQRAADETVYVLGLEQSEYLPLSHEAFVNHFRAEPDAPSEPAGPSVESAAPTPGP